MNGAASYTCICERQMECICETPVSAAVDLQLGLVIGRLLVVGKRPDPYVTRHLDLQLGLSSSDRISATGWNVPRYDHYRAGSANVRGLCGSDANTVIGAAAALLLAIGALRLAIGVVVRTARRPRAATQATAWAAAARCAIGRKRIASLALALLTLARAGIATTTVTSFAALSAANVNGAVIDVASDITFTSYLTVTGSVAMTSSVGAVLSGSGSTRLFYVSGGALTLSSLTLRDGYVSSCSVIPDTCRL